jgi:hypothetical protein
LLFNLLPQKKATMKHKIFTLLFSISFFSLLNAQETFIKLISRGQSTGITQMQKTREGNFIVLTGLTYDNSGYEKKTVMLLNPSGEMLWATVLTDNTNYNTMNQWSVVQAPDGGYIVVTNCHKAYPGYGSEILLTKLDRSGKIRRTQKIINKKTAYWQSISKVSMGPDGKLLLCGEQDDLKHMHAFLMKMDPETGTLTWAKAIGTTVDGGFKQSEAFTALLPTKDSGTIVCGTDSRQNDADLLYAKYDKDGNCKWIKRITKDYSFHRSSLNGIAETQDGNFIFYGSTGFKGRYNNFLLKTDNQGNPLWIKGITNPSEKDMGIITGIVSNDDNTCTVVGYYRHYSTNKNVGYICNVDAAGSVVWYHVLTSEELKTKGSVRKRNVYFRNIQKTGDNGYMVGGYVGFVSNGGQTTTDSLLLIKFNKQGNTCKDSAFITSSYNWNFTLPVFTYDTTDISSYLKIKDTTLFTQNTAAITTRDACPARADAIASVETVNSIDISSFSLTVFPNPAKGPNLYIKLSNLIPGTNYLSITDMNGKNVYAEKFVSTALQLNKPVNTSVLAPGMYIITVTNGNEKQALKFIKQ